MLSTQNNLNTAFRANVIKNDYLLSGINKAKDEAQKGNLDLAYQFYDALKNIKAECCFDTFEIRPINGIITRNDDAKPQEILINDTPEYKVRRHEDAKPDDGSQCIAGILEFSKLKFPNAANSLPSVYYNYIETKNAARKAEIAAAETVIKSLDTVI